MAGTVINLRSTLNTVGGLGWIVENEESVHILSTSGRSALIRVIRSGKVIIRACNGNKEEVFVVRIGERKEFPRNLRLMEGDIFTLSMKKDAEWTFPSGQIQALTDTEDAKTVTFQAMAGGSYEICAAVGKRKRSCKVRVIGRKNKEEKPYYNLVLQDNVMTLVEGEKAETTLIRSSNDPDAKITVTSSAEKKAVFRMKGDKLLIHAKSPGIVRGRIRYGTATADLEVIVEKTPSVSRATKVKAINHRGYSMEAPENTIPAFELSQEKGFDYVETDVDFTKDGVAVLLHDKTINRTACNPDGSRIKETIAIRDITYQEALQYDFGRMRGMEYVGTKIPTFEEFLQVCKYRHIHPYIELKPKKDFTKKQLQTLVAIVKKENMSDKVTWISFSYSALKTIKANDKGARIGYLVHRVRPRAVRRATRLRTGQNEVFLCATDLTDNAVALCYKARLPLELWGVNKESTMKKLDPYISGVISDSKHFGQALAAE